MIRIGTCAITLLLAGICLAAPEFRAPAKGAAPFRRDRLPIDPDRMAQLADQLTLLAGACASRKSPTELRASVQLLALAGALKPVNREADEMIERLRQGERPKSPAEHRLSQASSSAWQQHGWLASSQAGRDANLLAACLGDALAVADPEHPDSAGLLEHGEQGSWHRWIAEPAEFGIKPAPKPQPDAADPADPAAEASKPANSEPQPPADSLPLKLAQLRVSAPVHSYDPETKKSTFRIFPVQLDASLAAPSSAGQDGEPPPEPKPEYYVAFPSSQQDSPLADNIEAIRQALLQRHGGLPLRGRGKLSLVGGGSYRWHTNHDAIAAAVGLLMDASLSGQPPASEVIVLGTIDSDGSMRPSWRTWESLRQIATTADLPAGRLILPRDAAPMLEALLVKGHPDFFIRYEVLLAGSLAELAERAAAEPSGGQAEAAGEFTEIRKASAGEAIGPFLANRFVRERLGRILKAFPDHASARFALLQSPTERPSHYATPILAAELRLALQPMSWIPQSQDHEVSTDALMKTWKSCRELLDPVEDLTARTDEELWQTAFELVQSIRTLSSAIKRSRQDDYGRSDVTKVSTELNQQHAQLLNRLNLLTGEAQPADQTRPGPFQPGRGPGRPNQ